MVEACCQRSTKRKHVASSIVIGRDLNSFAIDTVSVYVNSGANDETKVFNQSEDVIDTDVRSIHNYNPIPMK